MPRNVLIGAFGGGVGIATSLLDCFWAFHNLRFDKMILVTTNSPGIHQGCNELRTHLQSNCPVCMARYTDLSVCLDSIAAADIVTEDDNSELLSKLLKHIRQESHPDTDIYLGLVGGRRSMNAIPVFAGMLFPVSGLYDAVVKDSQFTKEAERNRREWRELDSRRKKAIWEAESALWGIRDRELSQPPPTLAYHYNVKEHFHLLRLPFIGLTPFLEAFVRLLARPVFLTEQALQPEENWTNRWVESISQNQDVAATIRSLGRYFDTPIEDIYPPVLLRLERNDYSFWHDCIKHGVNNPDCTIHELAAKWQKQKTIFVGSKIGDPLFEEFDALFADEMGIEDVKTQFADLYRQLNSKICVAIRARSRPLHEWLVFLVDVVEEEVNSPVSFRFYYEDNAYRDAPICIWDDLDLVVENILRNALQHGKTKATITVTESDIIISNDGTFDAARWEKSPKSQDIPRICKEYNLEFRIGQEIEGGGVCASISWGQNSTQFLSVNARQISEGGNYVSA